MHTRLRRTLVMSAFAALVLTGCSAPTVSMAPAADDANDPGCAASIVRMPDDIGGYPLRTTDAQATAAWGNPTVALLYCGVPVPEVSELPCIEIGGVYWLRQVLDGAGAEDDQADYAFTTYGTDPAIRVVLDADAIGPGIALDDLSLAVSFLPLNGRECTSLENTVTGSE